MHLVAEKGRATLANLLIESGASVNADDYVMRKPLHYGAFAPNGAPVVSVLIAFGADVNTRDIYGETPLHRAVIKGNATIAATLIAAGAHWGEACESPEIVNPAGATPPCLCESPNVKTDLDACEPVAVLRRAVGFECRCEPVRLPGAEYRRERGGRAGSLRRAKRASLRGRGSPGVLRRDAVGLRPRLNPVRWARH